MKKDKKKEIKIRTSQKLTRTLNLFVKHGIKFIAYDC